MIGRQLLEVDGTSVKGVGVVRHVLYDQVCGVILLVEESDGRLRAVELRPCHHLGPER